MTLSRPAPLIVSVGNIPQGPGGWSVAREHVIARPFRSPTSEPYDLRSMSESFHTFRGSLITALQASGLLIQELTSSQYLSKRMPGLHHGQFHQRRVHLQEPGCFFFGQKPSTRSMPARLYQLRSKITTSPPAGK